MAETKVIQSTAASPQERARLRLTSVGPVINQMMAEQQAKQAKKDAALVAPLAAEPEKSGLPADPKDWSMKNLLESKPVPEDIDPFSRTLIDGVDPVAQHQVMTLLCPILSFLGHNTRVLYNDGTLRWISGQSWQMGGSGRGKSVVLRELETLFLSKELSETRASVEQVAQYAMLSEKERKEKAQPQNKVFIYKNFPTQIALLEQMQKNGGGAIYFSCTECGELGKKVSQPSYSNLLDMMKKSYDGTGEDYMHQNKEVTYYTRSMKICCNVGGTDDPMYRIFRYSNADGTFSRGNLSILPRRKNEKVDGKYKSPSWAMEQRVFLRECADRLRTFNNVFHENEKLDEIDECNALLEKYGLRKEGAPIPTVQDLEDCVQIERCARAVCIPEVLELGRDIKDYLVSLGDMASDCCSRADERAMGLCYLLLIANGFAPLWNSGGDEVHNGEAWTPEDRQLLRQCINVVHWWIDIAIDCAMAVQTVLNLNTHSVKDGVIAVFGEKVKHISAKEAARRAAFQDIETKYRGQEVPISVLGDYEIFARCDDSTWYRQAEKRGWVQAKKGLFRLPEPTLEDAS